MTDSEKMALISTIITDYWEFLTEEQQNKNAMGIIVAIGSICDFKGKD